MAKYALVGRYKFLDDRGRDVTDKYGFFNVAPKTEVPTAFIKGPGGNVNVRFIFTEKGRWEYQQEDPKSIEGWTARAFTRGEFTENSEWEDPRTPEKTLFVVKLDQPPIVFGVVFDNNKNIISNNDVYSGSVSWLIKDKEGEWVLIPVMSEISDGRITLDSESVDQFQEYGEVKASIQVSGFQNKEIIFNPKILLNKTGELPLRILMDRVGKTDKKKAIRDGLPAKLDNVLTKLK